MSTPHPSRRALMLGAATFGAAATFGTGGAFAAGTALKSGATGQAVTDLQNRLSALAYWCGEADGRFGPTVTQAVYALQKAAGLSRDGVVGPKTQAALDQGVQPEHQVQDGIEIDIDRQLLIASKGGAVVHILNTSTGNGKKYGAGKVATTPRGDYSIYRTYSQGWETAPLGRLFRPAYFHGGYAIHGYTTVPATPASHGCARVSVGAMDMLWAEGWTAKGTRVVLY